MHVPKLELYCINIFKYRNIGTLVHHDGVLRMRWLPRIELIIYVSGGHSNACKVSLPYRCNRSGMGSTSTILKIIQLGNFLPSGSSAKTQKMPIFTGISQPNILVLNQLTKTWIYGRVDFSVWQSFEKFQG